MTGMPKEEKHNFLHITWIDLGVRWWEELSAPPTHVSRWIVSSSLCFSWTKWCCNRFLSTCPIPLLFIYLYMSFWKRGVLPKNSEIFGSCRWLSWIPNPGLLLWHVDRKGHRPSRTYGKSCVSWTQDLKHHYPPWVSCQVSFNLFATYCWTTP